MADALSPFLSVLARAGKQDRSVTVPRAGVNAVGQGRKGRVVLSQPPHYGRVGAQITPPPRRSAAEHGAARAVQISHFEREYQVGKNGMRAVVR